MVVFSWIVDELLCSLIVLVVIWIDVLLVLFILIYSFLVLIVCILVGDFCVVLFCVIVFVRFFIDIVVL